MKTLGLLLGAMLLSVSFSEPAVSDDAPPWTFYEKYQITMQRVSTKRSPKFMLQDTELQELQADLAPLWPRNLEQDEMVDAILRQLAGRHVEVRRASGDYYWVKHADCSWLYACIPDTVITVDPDGDPIEIRVRMFVETQ